MFKHHFVELQPVSSQESSGLQGHMDSLRAIIDLHLYFVRQFLVLRFFDVEFRHAHEFVALDFLIHSKLFHDEG